MNNSTQSNNNWKGTQTRYTIPPKNSTDTLPRKDGKRATEIADRISEMSIE